MPKPPLRPRPTVAADVLPNPMGILFAFVLGVIATGLLMSVGNCASPPPESVTVQPPAPQKALTGIGYCNG